MILLSATNFVVALYDSEIDEISFPYYAHPYSVAPASQTLQSDTLTAQVIRTGQPLLLTPETTPSVVSQLAAAESQDAPNWLGVPLLSDHGSIGALVVLSASHDVRFSEQDRELLHFVAVQVVAALERKKMHSRLEYMAQHDQLTDLPNRTLVLDRLQTALTRARRGQTRMAVLYLDLDEFKQVNDTLGHTAGDHLLQEVARRLTRSVRESDTVGRMGGDEFIVLLDGIRQHEHAAAIADKILSILSKPYELSMATLRIIPSIGVAVYPEDGEDANELIHHADNAMYLAKNKRR